MDIQLTPQFLKSYRRLPQSIQVKAKKRIAIFESNQFDTRLRTHKLVGNNKEMWSFSVDYSYRIKFIFLSAQSILFLDIGTHSIY